MVLNVNRTNIRLNPDFKKVIARFFNTGNERSQALINRIVEMPDSEVENLLKQILFEFAGRYRDIQAIFIKHFELIKYLIPEAVFLVLSKEKKLLIGSYFTMEYSIEAAALFNPSVVEDPDQSGAAKGEMKVIVSFRATGESHISSLIFKRGTLNE
ncbi:MAG: glycosidase, partial [Flavitalea sp.]